MRAIFADVCASNVSVSAKFAVIVMSCAAGRLRNILLADVSVNVMTFAGAESMTVMAASFVTVILPVAFGALIRSDFWPV